MVLLVCMKDCCRVCVCWRWGEYYSIILDRLIPCTLYLFFVREGAGLDVQPGDDYVLEFVFFSLWESFHRVLNKNGGNTIWWNCCAINKAKKDQKAKKIKR